MRITVNFDSIEEFDAFRGKTANICINQDGLMISPLPAAAPTTCVAPEPVDVWKDEPVEAYDELHEVAQEIAQEKPQENEQKPQENEQKPQENEQKPQENEQKPAVDESLRVTVRKALAELNRATGKNTASELIRQFGVDKLTQVALEDLPALMEKVEAYGSN